ncbi:MAG: glycosyltransferase family 4 protein [Planctomycetaceae bacterium]|nr:glycosyltransferase family 4 protein [Planctomycetaceae bacterium]
MKVFGTVQPFIETSESSFKIGRLVANYEFFNALFKFSDFNEYHIFCPTYANCRLTQDRIFKDEYISQNNKDRIKIYHISSLKNSLEKKKYDVFHLGGWGFFYPGFAHIRNLYAKSLFPITGVTHSLNAKEATYHALKVCAAPVMPFDSIVCTSNCGKKVMQKLFMAAENNFEQKNVKYNGRLDIIPLGIDDKFRDIPKRSESRKLLGIDEDAFAILILGRIETDNKMDIIPFLNTVRRLIKKNADKKINLMIAGGCDKQAQQFLNSLLAEYELEANTKLFLNFENNLKTHLYRAANVYASPVDNFQETFGISVVEAMAHECAVVVSDFDGYSEIVDQNLTGIKIPTYWANITGHLHGVSEIMNFATLQLMLSQSVAVDQEKIFETLQNLLDNPEKCDAMGKRARAKALRQYLWPHVIRQYCCLWDELSKEAKSYKGEIDKRENPFELDYWKVFSHYPSEMVSEDCKISISIYGREILISGKPPLAYSDVSASVIIPNLVITALKIIYSRTIAVSQFIKVLKENADISDAIAMYYILWMLKYNLIKISE